MKGSKDALLPKIWTIGTILKWTQNYFAKKGIPSARVDAEVLLAYLLQKERIYLYVHFDEPMQEDELKAFHNLVKMRANRIPVAYIIGEKEFMGLTFKVSCNVLVPRPDTEILVESVLTRLPEEDGLLLADIGTGSGAIIISLLKAREDMKGYAVDISEPALEIANKNAQLHKIAGRIEFLQGDLLTPLKKCGKESFFAIVSNPPYIPPQDLPHLDPEVRCNEPSVALTDNRDGLEFYRRLLRSAKDFLRADGFLACEVGKGQADDVKRLSEQNGWGKVEVIKDLAGIERVLVIWKQK